MRACCSTRRRPARLSARRGAIDVQVRGISRFPQLLHAKVVVIDGTKAFLVGSPFVNGYWDDSRHRPFDERRPARELGGGRCTTYRACDRARRRRARRHSSPSCGTTFGGPEARHRIPARRAGTSPARDPSRYARLPDACFRGIPEGLAEILSAMRPALAAARSLVYIEHQYLSARPVVDALVAALAREPALEVIVVLNQNPDVTAYRGWQNARLARSQHFARHPRVGFFALWTAERAPRCTGASTRSSCTARCIVVG